MKRLLRWVLYALVGVFLLVALALYLVDTDFGRDTIRKKLVKALNESVLTGRLEIGRLDGSLYRELRVRDVALYDSKGRAAVTFDQLLVRIDLVALFGKRVRVEAVEVSRPSVWAIADKKGVLNLAELVRPGPPSPPKPPPPEGEGGLPAGVRIELGRFAILEGEARYQAEGKPPLVLKRIDLSVSAEAEKDLVSARIDRLALTSTAPDVELSLSAKARLEKQALSANLVLSANEAKLTADVARLDLGTLAARGGVSLSLPSAFLHRLGLPKELSAGVAFDASLSEGSKEAPWVVALKGDIAGAPWKVDAAVGPGSGSVRLGLSELDPKRVHAAAPPGALAIDLDANFPSWTKGHAVLRVAGPIQALEDPVRLDPLELTVDLDPARISVAGNLELFAANGWAVGKPEPSSAKGPAAGEEEPLAGQKPATGEPQPSLATGARRPSPAKKSATAARKLAAAKKSAAENHGRSLATKVAVPPHSGGAVLSARYAAELALGPPPVLLSSSLHLSASQLAKALPHVAPVLGTLEVEAGAKGALDDLAIQLSARGKRLAAQGATVDELDLSLDTTLPGPRMATKVRLSVKDLERGPSGPIDASVAIDLENRNIDGHSKIEGPAVGVIALEGKGRAPKDPSAAGTWMTEGELASADARIEALDLSKLVAITSTSTGIAGMVQGSAHAGKGAAEVKAHFEARGLRAPGLALPLDLLLDADARRNEIEAKIAGRFDKERGFDVSVRTNAGIEALKRRGAKAFETAKVAAKVKAAELPASLIALLAQLDPKDPRFDGPEGTVSVSVDGEGSMSAFATTASVSLHRFALKKDAPPIDAGLVARVGERRANVSLDVKLGDTARIALDAHADVPLGLDASAWARLDQRALRDLHLSIKDLRIKEVLEHAAIAGVPDAEVGLLVDLGPGLSRGSLRLAVLGVEADPHVSPIDLFTSVELEPTSIVTTASIALAKGIGPPAKADVAPPSPIMLRAAIAQGLEALIRDKTHDPELEAEISADRLPLERWIRAKDLASGQLSLKASMRGRPSKPDAHATMKIEQARLAGTEFEDLGVKFDLAGKAVALEAMLTQKAGGRLMLRAKHDLGVPEPPLDAEITAKAFSLAFVTKLARAFADSPIGLDGLLEGTVRAAGKRSDPDIKGDLRIGEMRVLLPGAVPPLERTNLRLAFTSKDASLDIKGDIGAGHYGLAMKADFPSLDNAKLEGRFTTDGATFAAGSQTLAIDTEIAIKGARRGDATSIDVSLDRTKVSLPRESGRKLQSIEKMDDVVFVDALTVEEAPQPVQVPESSAPIEVVVKTKEPIRVRGAEVEAQIAIDVAYRAKAEKRGVFGEVNVEYGRLKLIGRDYEVRQAVVSFDGGFPPDPRLDVRIASEIKSMTLLVLVTGSATAPHVRFGSEPGGYDQARLLAIFLGADPENEGSGGSSTDKAKSAAAGLIAGQIQNKLASTLPVDTIELDPSDRQAVGGFTVGRWVLDDVFVAYRQRFQPLEIENQLEGLLRWRFTRRWTLEGAYGDHSVGKLDAIWRIRW